MRKLVEKAGEREPMPTGFIVPDAKVLKLDYPTFHDRELGDVYVVNHKGITIHEGKYIRFTYNQRATEGWLTLLRPKRRYDGGGQIIINGVQKPLTYTKSEELSRIHNKNVCLLYGFYGSEQTIDILRKRKQPEPNYTLKLYNTDFKSDGKVRFSMNLIHLREYYDVWVETPRKYRKVKRGKRGFSFGIDEDVRAIFNQGGNLDGLKDYMVHLAKKEIEWRF